MTKITAIMLATLLAGCAQIEARKAQHEAELDDAKCASMGISSGMPAYPNCRMELERQRSAKGIH